MEDMFGKDEEQEQSRFDSIDEKKGKEQFVEQLREGNQVDDIFAVKRKSSPKSYKKGTWFEILVGDKTGDIKIKFWGGSNKERINKLFNSFKVGDIIRVKSGTVEVYENSLQISVNENVGNINKCEKYRLEDFVPALEKSKIRELYSKLRKEIDSIGNPYLKKLLEAFFDDPKFADRFAHAPSAIAHHHNYVGGNLEHTLNVVRICNSISEINPDINRDLLVTGAILHDIGKVEEYSCTSIIDKTESGKFVGHIVLGDRMVRKKIEELRDKGVDFPENLENQISHMILSHHGKHEWGSPEIPKMLEAVALHYADLLDSQIKYHKQKRDEEKRLNEEDWGMIWDTDLGRRKWFYLGDIQ